MTQEQKHYDKYEALAQKLGIELLKTRIPVSRENIKLALAKDEHLNNISLSRWDRAAGYFGHPGDIKFSAFAWSELFTREKANGLSLADRVCVLKHVAKYHY